MPSGRVVPPRHNPGGTPSGGRSAGGMSAGRMSAGRQAASVLAVVALAASVAACAGLTGAGSVPVPEPPGAAARNAAGAGAPGAVTETVTVRVRDRTVTAEVADSDDERRRGLMYRTRLPPDHGMIFDFGGETTSGFYMFRTLLPLSIMFVRDGRVVGVREMTPCSGDDPSACPVYYPDGAYTHAVEAPAHTFAGVATGDPVAIGSD
ncbi:DUF192 domain-containing protein [Frankia sp. Mgl5]|uniref:DUF192 domain-containing protein n=1 Tax=Frankia sp. Mgl5 TaxID=2933793 RepID=UPI00200C1C33|nr:DUF192 domain-containing protein [Frankia sp. Mgl5]MCK9930351.1 DUF192 domain-containing protein [Frankia sp. Mgl5]